MAQGQQLLEALRRASRDNVQRLIDNADLLEILMRLDPSGVDRVQFEQFIAGKLTVSSPFLFQERYTPGEIQVMNLRNWNNWLGFYSDDQIQELFASMPTFDWTQPRIALTLCWSMNTLWQTVATKLTLAKRIYGEDKVGRSSYLNDLAEGSIKLVDGAAEFVPNHLWWEVLDLGSVRNTAPDKVDPTRAAGTQVFDAVLQHPEAVRRMNVDRYWDVPALRVNGPEFDPWSSSPCVYGHSGGCVYFDTHFAGSGSPYYVGPLVVSGKS
jgi:hypothetical protein